MKNLLKTIALIFGIGQSSTQPQVFHHYHTYPTTQTLTINGKVVSHKVIPEKPNPKSLTQKEFVAYMATKNIICL